MKRVVTFVRNKNNRKYGHCLVVDDVALKMLKKNNSVEILSVK